MIWMRGGNPCCNPACPSLFRSLRHGKRFLLEADHAAEMGLIPGQSERTAGAGWNATGCATVALPFSPLPFECGRGMVTVPLPARKTDLPALHLKQLQPLRGYQRRVERAV